MAIIKLQTNIPLVGEILYADFQPTKVAEYSDQISLRGVWDGAGEGRVYLNVALETQLKSLGIVGERAANGNYPLLLNKPKVKITRAENGTKKTTNIELLDNAGPSPVRSVVPAQSSQTAVQGTFAQAPQQSPVTAKDLTNTYRDCLTIALEIWVKAGGSVEKNCPEIATGATALFNARIQRGLYGSSADVPF